MFKFEKVTVFEIVSILMASAALLFSYLSYSFNLDRTSRLDTPHFTVEGEVVDGEFHAKIVNYGQTSISINRFCFDHQGRKFQGMIKANDEHIDDKILALREYATSIKKTMSSRVEGSKLSDFSVWVGGPLYIGPHDSDTVMKIGGYDTFINSHKGQAQVTAQRYIKAVGSMFVEACSLSTGQCVANTSDSSWLDGCPEIEPEIWKTKSK